MTNSSINLTQSSHFKALQKNGTHGFNPFQCSNYIIHNSPISFSYDLSNINDTLIDHFQSLSNELGLINRYHSLLDGSIMTMQSTWHGPPGMMVRALCFHPNTYIKTNQKSS